MRKLLIALALIVSFTTIAQENKEPVLTEFAQMVVNELEKDQVKQTWVFSRADHNDMMVLRHRTKPLYLMCSPDWKSVTVRHRDPNNNEQTDLSLTREEHIVVLNKFMNACGRWYDQREKEAELRESELKAKLLKS